MLNLWLWICLLFFMFVTSAFEVHTNLSFFLSSWWFSFYKVTITSLFCPSILNLSLNSSLHFLKIPVWQTFSISASLFSSFSLNDWLGDLPLCQAFSAFKKSFHILIFINWRVCLNKLVCHIPAKEGTKNSVCSSLLFNGSIPTTLSYKVLLQRLGWHF